MVKRLHKILHVEHAGIEKEPQGTGYMVIEKGYTKS
jgi:hypothetical protein